METKLINVDKNNKEHMDILKRISKTTTFLGEISNYQFHQSNNFYNNDYMVVVNNNIVGYLGVSDVVATRLGNTISIYYGILEEYYGKKLGKTIVNLVKEYISNDCNIDYIIANVDNTNKHGKRIVEETGFILKQEFDDESLYLYENKLNSR